MVKVRIGVTVRNTSRKKPTQKQSRSQPVCPEQIPPPPPNATATPDRAFDFLIYQLEYVTLFRTETFRRLSLTLGLSSVIFLLLVSETSYVYLNELYDRPIIVITIAAFSIFTLILLLAANFLSSMVMDKGSLMIPSRILKKGKKNYKTRVYNKAVEDYKRILIREIYAVSRAEKHRSIILSLILRALVILYVLVFINSLLIVKVQNFTPKKHIERQREIGKQSEIFIPAEG